MRYEDALQYCLSLPDMERFSTGERAATMSLATMRSILERLGNPHRGRKTIHITGSKGKGSTSVCIASMLQAAGFSTALYTSPHLHDYTERIVVDMQPISRDDFAQGISAVKSAIDAELSDSSDPVSTFGAITALFFYEAQRRAVDWQIVEVGLGGQFDGTNVFDEKEVAVFTAISLEHTAILGPTTASIAASKAGIITPGATAVLAPQRDAAVLSVIANRCKDQGAGLIDVASDYKQIRSAANGRHQSATIETPRGPIEIELAMPGAHQLDNATTAIAVIQHLQETGIEIDFSSAVEALRTTVLPGRLEVLRERPLVIVDGAHNGESSRALKEAISRHFKCERLILILGMNADKNASEIVGELAPISDKVIATRSQSMKALPPEQMLPTLGEKGLPATSCESAREAIDQAMSQATDGDLILITGSLYLVGEARQLLLERPGPFCLTQSPCPL